MLLARRQGQDEPPPPARVDRLADDTPRHAAHVAFVRREEPDARPAVADGQAEALCLGDGDIGAAGTRRADEREREWLGRGGHGEGTDGGGELGGTRHVLENSEDVRLPEHDGQRVGVERLPKAGEIGAPIGREGDLADRDVTDAAHVGGDDRAIVRMERSRDPDRAAARQDAPCHQHRLGRCRGAVVHARVGDLEAEEQRGKSLELEGGLQGALTHLRLVGRVSRQELRTQQDLVDGRGYPMRIRAATEEHGRTGAVAVPRRQRLDVCDELGLGEPGGQIDPGVGAERRRDLREQRVDRRDADRGEHRRDVGVGVRGVAAHVRCCATNVR